MQPMLQLFARPCVTWPGMGRFCVCLALMLAGLSAQAADYGFPGPLPGGCSGSNGVYNCGTLTLGAGDTITIGAPTPATITFSGALTVGAGAVINGAGSSDNLTLVTNGVLTLGASVTGNFNVIGTAAINIGAGSIVSGNVAASTPTGVITLEANSSVGGTLSSNDGAITLGAGAAVAGDLSSMAGAVTLGANTKVTNVSSGDGAITIGNGTTVNGNLTSTGAGVLTLTSNVSVSGNISSNAGGVDIGDGSSVGGNITVSGDGVVTLTGVTVGGDISAGAGGVSLTGSQVSGSVTSPGGVTMSSSGTNVGSSAVAAGFECLETVANTPWAASARRPLYTKLAGTPFTFDVVALKTDGSLEANFVAARGKDRPLMVELIDGSGNTVCSARNAISPAHSQTLTFSAADQGRKSIAAFTLAKSYADLRCRVTDVSQSPQAVGCSSDDFSVRPGAVTLMVGPAMATPPSANALPGTKAGAAFTLRAVTSATASDAYSGVLVLDASKLTAQTPNQDASQTAGGAIGMLSPTTLTANAAPGNNATYDEVGYVYLAAGAYRDTVFTAVDQVGDCIANSSSVAAIGGQFGCNIGNDVPVALGRFYPDHFSVVANAVTAACVSSTPFTYFGQDGFTTSFTMAAKNLAGGTTKNYTGVFAKLDLTDYANYGFDAGILPAGANLGSSASSPSGRWVNGVAAVTAMHQVSRPTSPSAETAVVTSAAPSDGEVSASTLTAVGDATQMRYGRLRMKNVYGSELLDLPILLEAQYWTGSFYVTNLADSCTIVNASAIAMGNYQKQLNACKTQVSPAGNARLVAGKLASPSWALSKPGANNGGSVDLVLNLGATPSGKSCTGPAESAASAANMPWLGSNPTARATFGIFKSPILYRRENF